jgi:hypothetical protein
LNGRDLRLTNGRCRRKTAQNGNGQPFSRIELFIKMGFETNPRACNIKSFTVPKLCPESTVNKEH